MDFGRIHKYTSGFGVNSYVYLLVLGDFVRICLDVGAHSYAYVWIVAELISTLMDIGRIHNYIYGFRADLCPYLGALQAFSEALRAASAPFFVVCYTTNLLFVWLPDGR